MQVLSVIRFVIMKKSHFELLNLSFPFIAFINNSTIYLLSDNPKSHLSWYSSLKLWINVLLIGPDIPYIYAMIKVRRFTILLFLTISMVANGQYTKEFKRIFFDADYLFQTGFYEEAFNRYKNLLTLDPENSNILFHCGACCLNIPGNEPLAITYLKESIP